jgi:opacity protein-like surface antigen
MAKKTRSRLAALTLLEIAAGIAVTAVAVPALAADLPTKAPIMAAPYNWTGFYLGAHAGYRWADADFTGNGYFFDPAPPGGTAFNLPGRSEGYNPNGGIFGFQGGYNYQFAPNYLVGLEGDWSWGNASDSQNPLLNVQAVDGTTYRLNYTSEVKLGWQATIRGRLGYVQGPWLFYGTGGVAFIHVNWSDTNTLINPGGTTIATAASSASKTLAGFVVGGGAEYMLTRNWIGRLEYLYEDFGSFDVPYGFGPQTGNLDLRSVQKVRIGISYKFGD